VQTAQEWLKKGQKKAKKGKTTTRTGIEAWLQQSNIQTLRPQSFEHQCQSNWSYLNVTVSRCEHCANLFLVTSIASLCEVLAVALRAKGD